jgi:cell wall-associated NlpC family hydrolase
MTKDGLAEVNAATGMKTSLSARDKDFGLKAGPVPDRPMQKESPMASPKARRSKIGGESGKGSRDAWETQSSQQEPRQQEAPGDAGRERETAGASAQGSVQQVRNPLTSGLGAHEVWRVARKAKKAFKAGRKRESLKDKLDEKLKRKQELQEGKQADRQDEDPKEEPEADAREDSKEEPKEAPEAEPGKDQWEEPEESQTPEAGFDDDGAIQQDGTFPLETRELEKSRHADSDGKPGPEQAARKREGKLKGKREQTREGRQRRLKFEEDGAPEADRASALKKKRRRVQRFGDDADSPSPQDWRPPEDAELGLSARDPENAHDGFRKPSEGHRDAQTAKAAPDGAIPEERKSGAMRLEPLRSKPPEAEGPMPGKAPLANRKPRLKTKEAKLKFEPENSPSIAPETAGGANEAISEAIWGARDAIRDSRRELGAKIEGGQKDQREWRSDSTESEHAETANADPSDDIGSAHENGGNPDRSGKESSCGKDGGNRSGGKGSNGGKDGKSSSGRMDAKDGKEAKDGTEAKDGKEAKVGKEAKDTKEAKDGKRRVSKLKDELGERAGRLASRTQTLIFTAQEAAGEAVAATTLNAAKNSLKTLAPRYDSKKAENSAAAAAEFGASSATGLARGAWSANAKRRQKKLIKKNYAKALRAADLKGNAGSLRSRVWRSAKRVASLAVKKAQKYLLMAVAAMMCILVLFTACASLAAALVGGVGGALAGFVGFATYTAEEAAIDDAEIAYTEWEADLLARARSSESGLPGYDLYSHETGDVSHSPYELMAYLTAKLHDFTYEAAEAEMLSLFSAQYSLRSEVALESAADPATGEIRELAKLLTILEARPFSEVALERLSDDEKQHYLMLMETKGGRQLVGSPLDGDWARMISIPYGYRIDAGTGLKSLSAGVDVPVPEGSPIFAAQDGTVTAAGYDMGYGFRIVIEGSDGLSTLYAQCASIDAELGQEVRAGDTIAIAGGQLHFELMRNGRRLNPLFFAGAKDGAPISYTGDSLPPMGSAMFAAVLAEAEKYLGYPYVWGGSNPSTSFDCSGYITWVLNQSGAASFGRTTAQGIFALTAPISPGEAAPGDLVFFEKTYSSANTVTHVGIYVGGGRMIHCGSPIKYASIGTDFWQSHFYAFGRLP